MLIMGQGTEDYILVFCRGEIPAVLLTFELPKDQGQDQGSRNCDHQASYHVMVPAGGHIMWRMSCLAKAWELSYCCPRGVRTRRNSHKRTDFIHHFWRLSMLTLITAEPLLLHQWRQQESITPVHYLWSCDSTLSYNLHPHLYQIMASLTLAVKRSSHQHTAGSAFLGTHAIVMNSAWTRVLLTLTSWPSHCGPEGGQWVFC